MRALTVDQVGGVPWWGVLSSAAAPAVQIGGWTAAAWVQPEPFDSVRQSVSSLAGQGAADRWVMTATFVAVAICYLITALALRPAATPGRLALMAAALAGVLVAASPEAAPGTFSLAHALWATVGFALLAAWPLGAVRYGPDVPWALRPTASVGAVAAITLLTAWFLVEIVSGGHQLGLAERIAGVAQALWPLLVVTSCQLSMRRTAFQLPDRRRLSV
jgi:Protein of unknown function (DUF998)